MSMERLALEADLLRVVDARRDGTRVIYRLVNRSVVGLLSAAGDAVQEHLDRVSALAAARR